MTNARGGQTAPEGWKQYGEGEQLVLLVGLWKAIAAQVGGSEAHDEPNQQVRDIVKALGAPPQDEAPAKDEPEDKLPNESTGYEG